MTDNQQPAEGPEPAQPGLRFLEATVYIMGGLLVLMLVALLGGIAWKVMRKGPDEPPKTNLVEIATPAGASVSNVTIDGDRMAVHVVTGGTHEIVVVDTKKGTIVSRVRLKPEGP